MGLYDQALSGHRGPCRGLAKYIFGANLNWVVQTEELLKGVALQTSLNSTMPRPTDWTPVHSARLAQARSTFGLVTRCSATRDVLKITTLLISRDFQFSFPQLNPSRSLRGQSSPPRPGAVCTTTPAAPAFPTHSQIVLLDQSDECIAQVTRTMQFSILD